MRNVTANVMIPSGIIINSIWHLKIQIVTIMLLKSSGMLLPMELYQLFMVSF